MLRNPNYKYSGLVAAIDFDGSVVKHKYPDVGEDIGAAKVLRRMIAHGTRFVLNTMRSGNTLIDALKWFEYNNIPLFGVQECPGQKTWTTSTKVEAQLYIDDCGLNIPLTTDGMGNTYIDWHAVELLLFGDIEGCGVHTV